MSDNGGEVVLVTSDGALRQSVQEHRPTGAILRCLTPPEFSPSTLVPTQELWIDLDCHDGLPATRVARRVYFHSTRERPPPGLPPGLFLRKPCAPSAVQVLWAGVARGRAHPARTPKAAPTRWLPDWILEFHELGLRELCRKCVGRLGARLGYADVSMYLYDQDQHVLTLAETTHQRPIDLVVPVSHEPQNLMAVVARSGKLLMTRDVASEFRSRGLARRANPDRYADGQCLIAPLVSGGRLWGVLNFSRGQCADTMEVGVPLEPLFALIGKSLRYARAYDRARTQARVDPLTGLFNRRWMTETLTRETRLSQRSSVPLCTILIDIDELKAVNDRAGHRAGDGVLRHVAQRITVALRQSDSAARVGGDEFVVLLPATDLEGALRVARRMLESIRSDAAIFRSCPLPVSASLGVAQWQTGWTVPQLIEAADRAMYQAKQQGRNQIVCHPCHGVASSPATGPGAVDFLATPQTCVWPAPPVETPSDVSAPARTNPATAPT